MRATKRAPPLELDQLRVDHQLDVALERDRDRAVVLGVLGELRELRLVDPRHGATNGEVAALTIFQPPPLLSNVIVARTSRDVAGVPFFARRLLKAIEKHEACAAAMSSSGLVRPLCASVREPQVTGRRENAPDET